MACSEQAGQSVAEWLGNAARAAARRQGAAAYIDWEAGLPADRSFDEVDAATAEVSLSGAEW